MPAGEPLPTAVHLYDLTTGAEVGVITPPAGDDRVRPTFGACAFSPDGAEYGAYLNHVRVGLNLEQAMAVWEVGTGRLVYHKVLDRRQTGSGALGSFSPESLQWFPDGKGWLIGQMYVADRASGAVTQTVAANGGQFPHHGTKILDDRRVLAFALGKLQPVEVRRTPDPKPPSP